MNHINEENLANFFKERKAEAYIIKTIARKVNKKAAIDIAIEFNNDGKLVIEGHSSGNRLLALIALGEILVDIADNIGKPVSETIVDFLVFNADIFDKFDSVDAKK